MNILLGAIALGLLWSVMTVGVFVSYRVLDLADLTAEGSIVLGASVASVVIVRGGSPLLGTVAAALAGALAGYVTGLLHTRLRIPALLSGILVMIGLYSINIRIMGSANVSLLRRPTLLTPLLDLGLDKNRATILCGLLCAALVIAVCHWFFNTELGFSIRATGSNAVMARAQGIDTDRALRAGLSIGNGLVGLSGGLISQYLGFADVQMGTGAIVIGLASVIIGEVLFGTSGFLRHLCSLVLGAVSYRIIIALVIEAGMPATDLKLFTAITVAAALTLPIFKNTINKRLERKRGESADAAAAWSLQNLPHRNGQ